MILLSLALILGSLCLLVIGLLDGLLSLVIGSVAASVAAGAVLYIAARRRHVAADTPATLGEGDAATGPTDPYRPADVRAPGEAYGAPGATGGGTAPAEPPPVAAGQPSPPAGGWQPPPAQQWPPPPPPDEPPEERITPADAAWVAQRSDHVTVIDGRPRYHRSSCPHLIGRPTIALPVSEARDAAFTPCALCSPDAELLSHR